eukprot:763001-Hanusia_phi.AAC.8
MRDPGRDPFVLTTHSPSTALILIPNTPGVLATSCQRAIPKQRHLQALVGWPDLRQVSGVDGNPGCPADNAGAQKPWRLNGECTFCCHILTQPVGKVDGKNIFVDFSPKGGPKDLLGKWENDGIRWPDSNKWTKIVQKDYPQEL